MSVPSKLYEMKRMKCIILSNYNFTKLNENIQMEFQLEVQRRKQHNEQLYEKNRNKIDYYRELLFNLKERCDLSLDESEKTTFKDQYTYVYNMAKQLSENLGFLPIVDQVNRPKVEKLLTNEHSVKKLEKTFKLFGFDVVKFENKTVNETVQFLIEQFKEIVNENYDCLVVYISSHGENGSFLCDDSSFSVQSLLDEANRCVALQGNPKLFFIDTCQGDQIYNQNDPFTNTSMFPYHVYPDFVIHLASDPGFRSYTSTSNGAYFANTLADVLENNFTKLDLIQMLNMVNEQVSTTEIKFTYENSNTVIFKQNPFLYSTLQQIFKFYPKNCFYYDMGNSFGRKKRGHCVVLNFLPINVSDEIRQQIVIGEDLYNSINYIFQWDMNFHVIKHKLSTLENTKCAINLDENAHSNFSCFVLFIVALEIDGKIYSENGSPIEYKDILNWIKENQPVCLREKPKLIFIQTCKLPEVTFNNNCNILENVEISHSYIAYSNNGFNENSFAKQFIIQLRKHHSTFGCDLVKIIKMSGGEFIEKNKLEKIVKFAKE